MSPTVFICKECGSSAVVIDATAQWNIEEQCWELAGTFDASWCDHCGQEVHIEEVPLDETEECDSTTGERRLITEDDHP